MERGGEKTKKIKEENNTGKGKIGKEGKEGKERDNIKPLTSIDLPSLSPHLLPH